MKEISYAGLKDLWGDYKSSIIEKKMYLGNVLIGQILNIKRDEEGKLYAIARYVKPDRTSGKRKFYIPGNSLKLATELERVGSYYEINGIKYVPSIDTAARCLNDYFNLSIKDSINTFTSKEEMLKVACAFNNTGKINFIFRKPVNRFSKLIGMKSTCGESDKLSLIEIAEAFDKNFNDNVRFFTDYTEQTTDVPSLDFKILCKVNDYKTKNGTPLFVSICDNATGRKSMRISILAEIDNRYFILDSKELNHRFSVSAIDMITGIVEKLKEFSEITLNVNASACEIKDSCLECIPKKSRDKFLEIIFDKNNIPIKSAYDIAKTDIFNIKCKNHKTHDYDGGKFKYELSLGSVLRMKS